MTRNGVVYNLKFSPYTKTLNGIKFYFSSKYHLANFSEKIEENREKLKKSLLNRFKIQVNINAIYDVVLYSKIETRGFFIEHEGGEIDCLEKVVLNGGSQIESS